MKAKVRSRRILASLLVLLTLLSAGCRGGEGKGKTGTEETADILTHIWRGTALPLPEGSVISTAAQPAWDPESGVLTCAVLRSEQVNDEEGYYAYDIVHAALVETSADGVLSERSGILPDGNPTGIFRENRFFWLSQERTPDSYRAILRSVDLETGETTAGEDLLPLFEEPGIVENTFCIDGDGDFWFACGREIIAVTPQWTRRVSIPILTGGSVRNLFSTPDGRVWAAEALSAGGITVSRADKETGTLKAAISHGNAFGVLEGSGGCLFYLGDRNGIYGVTEEEGNCVEKLVMDYENSGVDSFTSAPLAVLAGDRIVMTHAEPETGFVHGIVPLDTYLYTPADDIDVSRMKTLTVAYTDNLTPAITAAVNRFHEEHADIRIELDDWTGRAQPGTWGGGAARMTQEIVTGLFVPDILYSASGTAVYIQQAYEKGLYVDLLPYLEADGLGDDLFGSVRRTFDDGDGGLWGFASHVLVDEVFVSTSELLGPYAEKGYWNLGEFLGFIENQPEGRAAYDRLTRTTLASFCEDAFRSFIDREAGTCSFDSPVFVRYLALLRSLPTEEEFERSSPFGGLDGNALAQLRLSGKIALSLERKLLFGATLARHYGRKDPVLIGHPSPDERRGAGMELTLRDVTVVMNSCENRDAAWDFIRLILEEGSGADGAPALRSLFRETASRNFNREYVTYFEKDAYGSTGYSWYLEEDAKPTDPDSLPVPGVVTLYQPEDAARMEEIYENAGTPLAELWNDALFQIVREEISGFLGGVGTAEDCAAKIQSRASIWLAERK